MLMIPPTENSLDRMPLLDGPKQLALAWLGKKPNPRAIEDRMTAWLAADKNGDSQDKRTPAYFLEAIAWAYVLKRISGGGKLGEWPDVWNRGLDALASMATADDLRAVAVMPEHTTPEKALVEQLALGELAWTLAVLFPNRGECSALRKAARATIASGLTELLDIEGMPHADLLPWALPLLASWTRSLQLEGAKSTPLGSRDLSCYALFVRNILRLVDAQGRLPLGDFAAAPNAKLLARAVELSGDAMNAKLAVTGAKPVPWPPKSEPKDMSKPKRKPRPKKGDVLPSPSVYCEEQCVAVLNRHWGKDRDRLAVLFGGRAATVFPEIALAIGGVEAAHGQWTYEATLDAQPLVAEDNWEEVCWVSDEDVDYLEIEQQLSCGVRLQRHLVLARKDRFLFLADALLAARPGMLSYCSRLPLAPNVSFEANEESCEGVLLRGPVGKAGASSAAGKPLAQVFPLDLPEWRAANACGSLQQTSGHVELRQTTSGQRLFAPLFFDLDPARFRRRFTWRKLVVAERLQAVPPDVAVGYRVAIGKQQWLIYRSLAKQGNRTLLGHNLSTETLVAKFVAGEVSSIVAVET
jgi:hypothetical protein